MTNQIDMGRPPTLDGHRCRFCSAEIVFARTASRALIPLEVEPARASEVPPPSCWWYEADEESARPAAREERTWAYLPHFATCPQSQKTPPANPELRRRWLANGGRL